MFRFGPTASILLLVVLIAAELSDALSVTMLRKLLVDGDSPKSNSTLAPPPMLSPVPSKPATVNNMSTESPSLPKNTSKEEPKGSNNTASASPPPLSNQMGIVNKDNKTASQAGTGEKCDLSSNKCRDKGNMIAHVQRSGAGSRDLVLVVQNQGEITFTMNITISGDTYNKDVAIDGHKSKKIIVPMVTIDTCFMVVLNSGHGDCILYVGPPASKENYVLQLPSYTQLLTPINGAYFMLLTVLIFGGSWACCKFRKKGRHGEVPYQELEMATPESVSAANPKTAVGWDQGWDDDWEDDNSTKSQGEHHARSASVNGLTLRSSNRDGWEKDD